MKKIFVVSLLATLMMSGAQALPVPHATATLIDPKNANFYTSSNGSVSVSGSGTHQNKITGMTGSMRVDAHYTIFLGGNSAGGSVIGAVSPDVNGEWKLDSSSALTAFFSLGTYVSKAHTSTRLPNIGEDGIEASQDDSSNFYVLEPL